MFVESSANRTSSPCLTQLGRSFVRILKRSGPNLLPCAIAEGDGSFLDFASLILVVWVRPVR